MSIPNIVRKLFKRGGASRHIKDELWPIKPGDLNDLDLSPTCVGQVFQGKDGRKYLVAGYGTDGDQEYSILVTPTSLLGFMEQGFKIGEVGYDGAYTQYYPDGTSEEVSSGALGKRLIFYPGSNKGPDIYTARIGPVPAREAAMFDWIQTLILYTRACCYEAARMTGHAGSWSFSISCRQGSYSYPRAISWSGRTGTEVINGVTYQWYPVLSNMYRSDAAPVYVRRGIAVTIEKDEQTHATTTYIDLPTTTREYPASAPLTYKFNRYSDGLLGGYAIGNGQYRTTLEAINARPFDIHSLKDTGGSVSVFGDGPDAELLHRIEYTPWFRTLNYTLPVLIEDVQYELHTKPEHMFNDPRLCKRRGTVGKYIETNASASAYQVAFGEARWHLNHWRQFLNSGASTLAGWWQKIGNHDCKTVNEDRVGAGFLSRIDEDIAAAAIPIPHKTYFYDADGNRRESVTNDAVWIASLEEIGMAPFNAGEGQCLCHWRYNPGDAVTELIVSMFDMYRYGYDDWEGDYMLGADSNSYLVRSVDDSGRNKFVKVKFDESTNKFTGRKVVDFKPSELTIAEAMPRFALVCIAVKGIWKDD
jgi:hypothetical protein